MIRLARGLGLACVLLQAATIGFAHAQTSTSSSRLRVRTKAPVLTRLTQLTAQSRATLVTRYGERLVWSAERKPGEVAQQGNPMLTFRGDANVSFVPNTTRYQFCFTVKNVGSAPSTAATLNVLASPGAESSLPGLTVVAGSQTAAVPVIAAGASQMICGWQAFKELVYQEKIGVDSMPRFLASISGELNEGKTAALYPGLMWSKTSGSTAVPNAGPMLRFTSATASTSSGSNVIHPCYHVTNAGPGAVTGAPKVQVAVTIKGTTSTSLITLPLLASGASTNACADVAVQGLDENRFGATSLEDGLKLVGSFQGVVNDGTQMTHSIKYIYDPNVLVVP